MFHRLNHLHMDRTHQYLRLMNQKKTKYLGWNDQFGHRIHMGKRRLDAGGRSSHGDNDIRRFAYHNGRRLHRSCRRARMRTATGRE